jgi:hypothetical protein
MVPDEIFGQFLICKLTGEDVGLVEVKKGS